MSPACCDQSFQGVRAGAHMMMQEMRPEDSTKVPLMRETYAMDVSA